LVEEYPELNDRGGTDPNDEETEKAKGVTTRQIFRDIVKLRAGEALLFSPSSMIGLEKGPTGEIGMKRLGAAYLKIKVRKRLTTDGGKSVMAL
jgi:hypothetical protein